MSTEEQKIDNLAIDPDDIPAVELPKAKRTFYVIILYFLFMSDFWARIGVNSLFPVIQTDLGLSDVQIGTLSSTVLFGMMVLVTPLAYLSDKWSKTRMIQGMGITWSVGTILCGMASTFFPLLAGRFLVGAGNASYAPASVSTITDWYPRKKWGTIISIYNTSMIVGSAGGMVITGILASMMHWKNVFFVVGGVSLALSFLAFLLPKAGARTNNNPDGTPKEKITLKETFKVILGTKSLICAAFAGATYNFVGTTKGVFDMIFYTRELGMEIAAAAGMMGLAGLLGVVGGPLGGMVLDKFTKKSVRNRGFVPIVFLLLGGAVSISGYVLGNAFLVVAGGFFTACIPSAYNVVSQEAVPARYKSSSYGTIVVILQLGGVLGGIGAGLLSEALGLRNALIAAMCLYLLVSFFFFLIGIFYPNDMKRVQDYEAGNA